MKSKPASKKGPSKSVKALQKASEYQEIFPHLQDVGPIVEFLENFRIYSDPKQQGKSHLISIKIAKPLLQAFRFKAKQQGVPYQTMIKKLMENWLREG